MDIEDKRKYIRVKLVSGAEADRSWAPYIRNNPKLWSTLRSGGVIDFPEEELRFMRGTLIDINKNPQEVKSKPKRVVKDNKGNIWADGKLVSGPDFKTQARVESIPRQEMPSADRLRKAQEEHQKSEESPSSDEEISSTAR